MKLLVVTQALDLDDPLLSSYHEWVAALADECERVEAVCLAEGRHALPANVTVHSLGKERGARSPLSYAWTFLRLAWKLRGAYDAVFVHMNQEYLLVAGPLWKLLGKPAFLWRNHYAGSLLTDLAAFWCTSVFCTSRRSYTAKYRKTVLMPVGVNVTRFEASGNGQPTPSSILFFSRITPSKHAELFIEALALLTERGRAFTARIVGSAPPEHAAYAASLASRAEAGGLAGIVAFLPGIANADAPGIFRSSEVYVNCSPSGMLDKMIFEAAASGCLVATESEDMRAFGFGDVTYEAGSAASLASHIERLLGMDEEAKRAMRGRLRDLVEEHSLPRLAQRLVSRMSSSV